MSILDELRKKADEKKAAERQEANVAQYREKIYTTKILPKMQLLFNNFNEIVDYLNILDEPIEIKDYCSKYPQFGDLVQTHYRINTDGRMGHADYNRLMEINLNFYCEGKGDFTYTLESGVLIRKEIDFLQSKKINFDWKHIDPVNGVPLVSITIPRKIPASFRIAVDYQHCRIQVVIKNHQNLDTFANYYDPEEFNEDFIDRLLSYLLRRSDRFVKGEDVVTPDVSTKIKAAIKSNFANIEQKLGLPQPEVSSPEHKSAENTREKKPRLIKSLFERFHKKS